MCSLHEIEDQDMVCYLFTINAVFSIVLHI
jgi:hypothetical protein